MFFLFSIQFGSYYEIGLVLSYFHIMRISASKPINTTERSQFVRNANKIAKQLTNELHLELLIKRDKRYNYYFEEKSRVRLFKMSNAYTGSNGSIETGFIAGLEMIGLINIEIEEK